MAKDERVYRSKVPVPPKKIYQVKIFEEDDRQKLEKKINNWLKKNENINSMTIKCVHTHHEKGQKYSVIIKYRTK